MKAVPPPGSNSAPARFPDVVQRLRRGPRVAIGALGAQRVVDVAHVHQAAGVVGRPGIVQRRVAARRRRGGGARTPPTAARSSGSSPSRIMRAPSAGWASTMARSSAVSLPGLVRISRGILILPRSWSSPASPNAAHRRRAHAEELAERHGQHRDVDGVGRGVLVELLELEQRQHHRLTAVHRQRERPDHAVGLERSGDPAPVAGLLVQPARPRRAPRAASTPASPLAAARRPRRRSGAVHPDPAEPDARRRRPARRPTDASPARPRRGRGLPEKALEVLRLDRGR